jgi:hypothetical protein
MLTTSLPARRLARVLALALVAAAALLAVPGAKDGHANFRCNSGWWVPMGHKPPDMSMQCIYKVNYVHSGSLAWVPADIARNRARGAEHCKNTWKRSSVYHMMPWYQKYSVLPAWCMKNAWNWVYWGY